MAKQQWNDEDLNTDDTLEGSDLVKDLRRVIKNLKTKASDLETEVKEFRSTSRSQTVAEALKANGLDAKVAKFVPADVEGDALTEWIKDNAEFFGGAKPADETADPDANADPAEVASRERLAALSGSAATPATTADFAARLAAAKTPEELQAVFKDAAAAGL